MSKNYIATVRPKLVLLKSSVDEIKSYTEEGYTMVFNGKIGPPSDEFVKGMVSIMKARGIPGYYDDHEKMVDLANKEK